MLGDNIRSHRRKRGMTLRELSDALDARGCPCSVESISQWERGVCTIKSDYLPHLANALNCSIDDLFDHKPHLRENITTFLSEEELAIMRYIAHNFGGNPHPLIHLCGMYVSLPDEMRAEFASEGIRLYKEAMSKGTLVEDAPIVDLMFVVKERNRLEE